jgi:hypothetical protein
MGGGVVGVVLGLVSLVVSGFLVWKWRAAKESIYQMKVAEARPVRELKSMAGEIATEIGRGSFNEVCEVVGKLGSDEPLAGELSGEPCAYFRTTISRKWEEEVEEWDEQQKKHVKRTRSGSEVVSSTERRALAWIDDGTGRLDLRLDGAKMDLVEVEDRFEPGKKPSREGLKFSKHEGNRRTLGFRYEEELLPLGVQVYVLGEVTDSEGLAMRKPSDANKRFLVSTKSEEEMLRGAEKSKTLSLIGAVAAAAIGVLAILAGIAAMLVSMLS